MFKRVVIKSSMVNLLQAPNASTAWISAPTAWPSKQYRHMYHHSLCYEDCRSHTGSRHSRTCLIGEHLLRAFILDWAKCETETDSQRREKIPGLVTWHTL